MSAVGQDISSQGEKCLMFNNNLFNALQCEFLKRFF